MHVVIINPFHSNLPQRSLALTCRELQWHVNRDQSWTRVGSMTSKLFSLTSCSLGSCSIKAQHPPVQKDIPTHRTKFAPSTPCVDLAQIQEEAFKDNEIHIAQAQNRENGSTEVVDAHHLAVADHWSSCCYIVYPGGTAVMTWMQDQDPMTRTSLKLPRTTESIVLGKSAGCLHHSKIRDLKPGSSYEFHALSEQCHSGYPTASDSKRTCLVPNDFEDWWVRDQPRNVSSRLTTVTGRAKESSTFGSSNMLALKKKPSTVSLYEYMIQHLTQR